jgi:serpin B
MERIIIIIVFAFTTLAIKAQNPNIESINRFSFKILEQVNKGNENCFYSPFSIFGALSMTYAGAGENTKLEMEQVLELTSKENIHQSFKQLTDAFALEREISFLSSNSFWVQKNIKIEKKYTELLHKFYAAKIENVNFVQDNDREKTRLQINDQVEKDTKGNLKDFIPKGIIQESTLMLIINAVYFNAQWNTEFPEEKITSEKFHTSSGDSTDCKMMYQLIETGYYEDEQVQVLELPYQGNKASMILFLPKEPSKKGSDFFNFDSYSKVLPTLKQRPVEVSIPKFRLETSYELSESLVKMGMKSAFAPGADFSGITGSKGLILDKVLHKSVVDVSEKGTEASSATAVISMRSTKIGQEPVKFNANRPFYFIIKQNPGNMILFMGYLAKP